MPTQDHEIPFKASGGAGGLRLQRSTEAYSISVGRPSQDEAERLIKNVKTGTTSAIPVKKPLVLTLSFMLSSGLRAQNHLTMRSR